MSGIVYGKAEWFWMMLLPSIEVSPSPWQASRVGAMTSTQPGAELTHGYSGLYKVGATSGFPPSQMAALQGSPLTVWGVSWGTSFW